MHYEIILSSIKFANFQHFYPANTKKVNNFSKFIIKKVFTPKKWGISTMKEREYTHLEQNIVVRFNNWVIPKALTKPYYMRC